MEKCKGETFRMLQLQDVITPANRHLAKEGDFGFVSDRITELIEMVNNLKFAAVVKLQANPDEPDNIEFPFVANEKTKYRYFYKLEKLLWQIHSTKEIIEECCGEGDVPDEPERVFSHKYLCCPCSLDAKATKDSKKFKGTAMHVIAVDEIASMNEQAEKDSALKSYAETCRSLNKPFIPHTHTFKLTNKLCWHIVEKNKPVLEQKCVCIECGEEYWEPVITFVEL